MSAPDLRPYQRAVVADFHREVAAGRKRVLLVAPTGAGKTILAAAIIQASAADRKPALVLAHRREIVGQTSNKLWDVGIRHGIIQAGTPPRPFEDVQVASVQTLWSRAMRSNAMELPVAELLVIDEAHHCPAETYQKIIDAYPDAVLLGLTATPCRGDGRGLGGIFETLIECPQVAQLIEEKFLVRTRCYAPVVPDLSGVRTQAGDYVESQLAERMDKPQLIGDAVTHWHKFGERRKTVAFAVNVPHSLHICNEFIKSGVRAEHIDGSTPKAERDAALQQLASGEIELISNCMVLTEGWDMPEVGCVILARPTKKMGLYRQMIGRVLRPAPGKVDAIVLDHSGAVYRHGFVEDPVEWTLDPDTKAESSAHRERGNRGGTGPSIVECANCGALRVGGDPCFHCGYLPQRTPRAVDVADGELARVDRRDRRASVAFDPIERERWHRMLVHICREREYKPGWAACKYKDKFGAWPKSRFVEPLEPTLEVRSWVHSRNIAFARRKSA
jgi:DNA repair protein RadD